MHFGASMFFTDYSMTLQALKALGERGFESVWAPELHSAEPQSPFIMGGELLKRYDVMDPFVTITAAAMATTNLRVGTGICLVNQRDPFKLQNPSLPNLMSEGRFLFGIGNGWNQDEMENHVPISKPGISWCGNGSKPYEIWTQSKPEYHGEFVNFDHDDLPKPVQNPPPILIGGAFLYSARRAIRYGDGWMPQLTEKMQTPFAEQIPARQMAEEAGRDPETSASAFGAGNPTWRKSKATKRPGLSGFARALNRQRKTRFCPYSPLGRL